MIQQRGPTLQQGLADAIELRRRPDLVLDRAGDALDLTLGDFDEAAGVVAQPLQARALELEARQTGVNGGEPGLGGVDPELDPVGFDGDLKYSW